MTIKTVSTHYLPKEEFEKKFPNGKHHSGSIVSMGEAGYSSVKEMRKELRRRFGKNKKHTMEDIPNGIRYTYKRSMGFYEVKDVTLS